MHVRSAGVYGAEKGGCFKVGCLIAAGFFGIIVLVGVLIFMKGKRELEPVAEKYLVAVENEKYDAAWAMVGESWRSAQSGEGFIAFEKAVRAKLGALKEKSMTGVHISSNSSGTTARIVYSAEFENGSATMTFTMSKPGDAWLIEGVRYDSPLLRSLANCPKCGKGIALGATFCSGCGAPLTPEAADDSPADAEEDSVVPVEPASDEDF